MTRLAWRVATFALATVVILLAPSALRAQGTTCEPGDQEVRALEFRGNRAIDDDDLARRVTTTPSSWARRRLHWRFAAKRCLNPNELPLDVLRLLRYYRDRGFYSAKVDTLVQPMGRSAVRVVFTIEEGPASRVTSYTVNGLEGIGDSAAIVNRLQLRAGRPFDVTLLVSDMDTITSRLRNAGYYRAAVVHDYDREDTTARVALSVIPGKRARFGVPLFDVRPIDEERGQQIKENILRRVLGISPGDYYSDRAIVEAQRNLFQLGAFRHIEVAPLPDSVPPANPQAQGDTIVILRATLTEDYMRQLDSELGWATLDCARLRLQYTDKNVLGTARRLELTSQASKIGYGYPLATTGTRDMCTLDGRSPLASDSTFSSRLYYYTGFSLRQPRLLGTRWVPTLAVYSERRGEYKAYLRSTQIGVDFSATREIGDRMPLRLAYTFEYGQTRGDAPALCTLFDRCEQQERDRIQQLLPLGVASLALARVRTDNVINPTRGLAMRGEVRTSASKALLTSDSLFFNKATGDVAWYRPFGGQNVLAIRLRGGAVLGRRLRLSDPSGFIPPQERLYAGGPMSVRGFQQNELGRSVYIARSRDVEGDTTVVAPGDTIFSYRLKSTTTDSAPERAVPLGGNSLVVANFEYRIRDRFLFPDLLQYTFFVDGGDVWTRSPNARLTMKWTPGFAIRALTPVGPVQVNVGYNDYRRERGALYYNPNSRLLACVTPGSNVTYRLNPTNGQLEPSSSCPDDFTPPERKRLLQRLTFTFSIGPDF